MKIPSELLEEILYRVEVSDLLKLKCVCKSLLQLISSPEFIQKHKNRSKTSLYLTLPHAIIDYENSQETFYGWKITRVLRNPTEFSMVGVEIMGSCDGLVCLLFQMNKIVLFNPSIGKSVRFDLSDCSGIEFYWFGRHPCTDEYTLVLGRPNKIQVRKLCGDRNSSRLGSVDQEIHGEYPVFEKIGTLLHGSIHWQAFCKAADGGVEQRIVTYNFQYNKVSELSVPCKSVKSIGVLDGCLVTIAILNTSNTIKIELWVMKDYGLNESWSLHDKTYGLRPIRGTRFRCLGFSSDGYVLLEAPEQFIIKYMFNVFNVNGPTVFQHLECKQFRAITFQETLFFPEFDQ